MPDARSAQKAHKNLRSPNLPSLCHAAQGKCAAEASPGARKHPSGDLPNRPAQPRNEGRQRPISVSAMLTRNIAETAPQSRRHATPAFADVQNRPRSHLETLGAVPCAADVHVSSVRCRKGILLPSYSNKSCPPPRLMLSCKRLLNPQGFRL